MLQSLRRQFISLFLFSVSTPAGRHSRVASMLAVLASLAFFASVPGCGATKSYTATEQLLMSDAVDSTISKIDFRPLSGQKVFLDTTFAAQAGKPVPGVPTASNLVNSDYVISGIRQQMVAAGCLLVDKKEDADIVCEARCGALGTDGHSVIYGIPASSGFGGMSSLIAGAPIIPATPEISFAKRELKSAASKVAVFAYDRDSREPIWQSGIAQAGSNARDTWFLGIGPWQYGTIYRGTRFAGKRIKPISTEKLSPQLAEETDGVNHREGFLFARKDREIPILETPPARPVTETATTPNQTRY